MNNNTEKQNLIAFFLIMGFTLLIWGSLFYFAVRPITVEDHLAEDR